MPGLSLANNVSALNAQNNLTRSTLSLNRSIERLSSGLQVNRGADGPAALVISERQRAQISGLRAAIDNTDQAVAVVQTAEGALGEINNLLVQVRSLAIDSANTGVNDEDALAANQAEIANALDTINRIATNTQFGERRLLDGSAGANATALDSDVTVVTAAGDTQAGTFGVNITQAATAATVSGGATTGPLAAAETLTVNGVNISLDAGLTQAEVRDRINEFSDVTGVIAEEEPANTTRLRTTEIGADASITVQSSLAATATTSGFANTETTATGQDIAGTIDGVAATGSGTTLTATTGNAAGLVIDIALADDVSSVTGAQGNIEVTNNSLVFQIGANQGQTVAIGIGSVAATNLGIGVDNNQFANLNEIDVTSADAAQDTLGIVDAAIDEISNIRGTLGAFQGNTLESTANNLRTTLENTVNAESVIRDTDFAEEISNFTNAQVLVQAGTSVLSNANQSSQLVLSLLG